MLQYSGYRSEYGVKLILLGDGQSKSVSIDLKKEPFGISFGGSFPKAVVLRSADGERPACTTDGSGVITITYQQPLGVPMENTLTPRSQLDLYLLYGPSSEE